MYQNKDTQKLVLLTIKDLQRYDVCDVGNPPMSKTGPTLDEIYGELADFGLKKSSIRKCLWRLVNLISSAAPNFRVVKTNFKLDGEQEFCYKLTKYGQKWVNSYYKD